MPSGLLNPVLREALENVEVLDLKNYSPNGWQDWLTRFNLYMEQISFNSFPDGVKVFALLEKLGEEGMTIFNVLNGPKPISYNNLLKLFDDYFIPTNTRYIFFTLQQRDDEPFTNFAQKLVVFSYPCRFQSQDLAVRDAFIVNMHDKYAKIRDQLRLLGNPSLKQTVDTADALLMNDRISIPQMSTPSLQQPSVPPLAVPPSITQIIGSRRPQSACSFDDYHSETARMKAKYALPNIYVLDIHEVEVLQVTEKGAFVWLSNHHKKRIEFFKELNAIYNSADTPPIQPKHVGQYVVLDKGNWYRVDMLNVDYQSAHAEVLFLDHGYCRKIPLQNFRVMNTKVVEVEPLALRVTFADAQQRNICLSKKKLKLKFMELNTDRTWLVQVIHALADVAPRNPSASWQNRGYETDDHAFPHNHATNGNAQKKHNGMGNSGNRAHGQPAQKEQDNKVESQARGAARGNGEQRCGNGKSKGAARPSKDTNTDRGRRNDENDRSSGVCQNQNRRDTSRHSGHSNTTDEDPLSLKPLKLALPNGYESDARARQSNPRANPKNSPSPNANKEPSELPPLPIDQFIQVSVAQVAGGRTFVVPMLEEKMSKRPVVKPREGMTCAALYEGDWYRATILDLNKEKNQAKILYIDFGNSSVVDTSELRTVPPHLITKSVLQYPIRIKGGRTLQPDEKASIKPLSKGEGGVWLVEMEDTVDEPHFLKPHQLTGQSQEPSRLSMDVLKEPVRRPKPPPIPHGKYTTIVITYTGEEGTFACTEDNAEKICALNAELANLVEKLGPCKNLVAGKICVVPFEDEFFRAKVTEFIDNLNVEVVYVDYGNVAVVKTDSLLELPDCITTDVYTFKIKTDFKAEDMARYKVTPIALENDEVWLVKRESEQ